MSAPPAPVVELAALVERVSGNVVPPGHLPFLGEVGRRRAASLGLPDLAAYVRALGLGNLADEWRWLLPHVTVKESYLFRTPQHFAALESTILPRLAAARAGLRALSVWSAGCARGEEPASLAVALAEHRALAGWRWRILATDVDEDALAAARLGRFGARAVAGVPPALLDRHFDRRDDMAELHAALRERIDYRVLNLVHEPLRLPAPAYDLIFLRNVLIYFRVESQRRVAAAIAQALAPDGFLFLGPAETLWQVCDELEPVDLEDCFCYRRRDPPPGAGNERAAAGRRARSARPAPVGPAAAGVAPRAQSARPVESQPAPEPGAPAVRAGEGGAAGGTAERLAAAAAELAANRLAEAVEIVEEALRGDPADPAAHALEGLLHDVSGRSQMALASYRAALFLDERLFQVRLLLADSLRRLGGAARAEVEYRRVMTTLAGGRARSLDLLAPVPLPTSEQAMRRCREALGAF